MINYHRIQNRLFVGTCPQNETDVIRLQQDRVSAVFNLQSDLDLIEHNIDWSVLESLYVQYGISAHRAPMVDFDEVNIEANLTGVTDSLASVMDNGHCVYLHCTAGRERSPTTAVAWMTWYGGMSLDLALDTMRKARPSNPYEAILQRLTIARSND